MTTTHSTDRRSGTRGDGSYDTSAGRREGNPTGVDRLAEVAEASIRRPTAVIGFLMGALITVAVVLLIVQNRRQVPVAWLSAEVDLPLWSVVFGAFAAGLVVAPLLYAGFRLVTRRRRERLELIERAGPEGPGPQQAVSTGPRRQGWRRSRNRRRAARRLCTSSVTRALMRRLASLRLG